MYMADEIETAIEETREDGKTLASCGTFETLCDLVVVDLTAAPPCPSILVTGSTCARGDSDFLSGLVDDVSKSIKKDDHIHTEYVPTQVVAEYIQHKLKVNDRRVDGILYSSSKGSGKNFVFFIDDRYIEGSEAAFAEEAKFRLVHIEHRQVPNLV
jgi:hypothetical protein